MLAELSAALIAEVDHAAKLLGAKQRICILTGAGISAESGIPTFRDKQTGLWENYGAEDLATPEALHVTQSWFGDGISGADKWSPIKTKSRP